MPSGCHLFLRSAQPFHDSITWTPTTALVTGMDLCILTWSRRCLSWDSLHTISSTKTGTATVINSEKKIQSIVAAMGSNTVEWLNKDLRVQKQGAAPEEQDDT